MLRVRRAIYFLLPPLHRKLRLFSLLDAPGLSRPSPSPHYMQVSPSDPLSSPLQRILRRCSVRNSCYTYANRALIFSFFTLLSSLNSLLPFLKSALSFQSQELLSLHRLFPVTLSLQSSFFYPTASLFNVSHTGNSHRREAVASFSHVSPSTTMSCREHDSVFVSLPHPFDILRALVRPSLFTIVSSLFSL